MSFEVRNLRVYFYLERGVLKAVDGVNLEIDRGESLGLVGESGSGKSTVALSIMKLVPPPGRIVGGEVIFNGENLLEKSEEEMRRIRGSKISMIFQDPMTSLDPVFTIGYQVSEPIKIHQSIRGDEVDERVIDILEKVRIPDAGVRVRDYPHQLSGGMRQRVMMAMALSCNPELLIADEPTTNLDVTVQAQILELMKRLKREFNSSLLLITHNLGIIAEMTDRVAVMYCGKVMEYADVYEIFKRPMHPYTKALLEAIPTVGGYRRRLKVITGSIPDMFNPPSGCRFHPRCPYSEARCVEVEPGMVDIGSGHYVACHLVDD